MSFEVIEEDSENIKQDFLDNFCYRCGCKPIYLFQDRRCKFCTRMLPEEVTGELL